LSDSSKIKKKVHNVTLLEVGSSKMPVQGARILGLGGQGV